MAICRILSAAEEETTRAYIESAGYEVLDRSIPEAIFYRQAQNRGQAITETKSAKLNKQADALMEALLRRIIAAIRAGRSAQKKTAERKR
jgi:hypothetical protein